MKKLILTGVLILIKANGLTQNSVYINGKTTNKNDHQPKFNTQNVFDCEAELLFNTNQIWPLGLATDGINFWVSGLTNPWPGAPNSWTMIYDFAGNSVDTLFINGDSQSFSGLCLQEDTLWATREQEAELFKIHKYSAEIYDIFQLPTNAVDPNNWGITFDGEFLWNCEYSLSAPSFLYKINPANGIALDTLFVNIPALAAIEFINGKMYGVDIHNLKFFTINMNTGEAEYISDWCINEPSGISFDAQNGAFYGLSGQINYSGTQSVNKLSGFDFISSIGEIVRNVDFKFWPNPAIDYIFISFPKLIEGEVQLIDISGRVITTKNFSEEKFQLSVRDLPQGSYFIRIKYGDLIDTQRFIKLISN